MASQTPAWIDIADTDFTLTVCTRYSVLTSGQAGWSASPVVASTGVDPRIYQLYDVRDKPVTCMCNACFKITRSELSDIWWRASARAWISNPFRKTHQHCCISTRFQAQMRGAHWECWSIQSDLGCSKHRSLLACMLTSHSRQPLLLKDDLPDNACILCLFSDCFIKIMHTSFWISTYLSMDM